MDWIATIGHSWLISLAWLIGLAVVFGIAARLMPCNPGMFWWQNLQAVGADFMYWFLGPLFVRFGRTLLMTAGMALLFGREESWASPLKDLPLWQQCVAIQLIQDVLLYWIHRIFHTRLAWNFHSIHH